MSAGGAGAAAAGAAAGAAALVGLRAPPAYAGFEALAGELVAATLRSHDDGRFAREELYAKLEGAGYAVGRRLGERLAAARDRLPEPLDAVKLLCREVWPEVFKRPVDKLQTNNRGVFVLQDYAFRWLRHASPPAGAGAADGPPALLRHTLFPAGLVRGALAALGLDVAVNVDISGLPRAVFHIRVRDA